MAGDALDGLLHRLRQGRVGEDVAGHLVGGEVPLLRQGQRGQQLGHLGPDQVGADDLVVLRVRDDLHEPDALGHAARLAVGRERELRHLDVVPLLLGLGLGVAERRDLRLAERRPRDHVEVDLQRLRARDRLGGDDTHRLGGVRQHQLAGHVADRVDALDVGAAAGVDRDRATIGQLDPGLVEPVALDPRREADRLEHLVGLEDLFLAVLADGDLDLLARVVDALDLGRQQDLHAQLLVLLEQLLGDVGVLGRDHPVEELHDRHVDAEVLHHVGELDADGAGPGDDDRAGQLVGEDLLLVGHDPLRQRGAGDEAGLRARGDDQVVAGVRRGPAVLVLHVDGLLAVLGAHQGAPAVELGDLVLLHQVVHALGAGLGDTAAALVRDTEVHGGVPGDAEDVLLLRDDVRDLGVAQQGLGGDAAHVEADTTPVLLLDHGHGLTELGCADGRHVTTGAGTKDENIEVGHGRQPMSCAAQRPRQGLICGP